MRRTLRRYLPTPDSLRRNRMLRPMAGWLERHGNWQLNAQSVGRGVALGLFFGFLIPVAQVVFAVIAAMFLRANPPVAALATLVTNPITFPFVYLVAYRIGRVFIEAPPVSAQHAATLGQAQLAGALESFSAFWQWMSGVGQPLVVGLVILAVSSAVLGYLAVLGIWRAQAVLRLRRRRRSRRVV
ncbi:MAG: DUF2062 domain-containing protein [Rhodocyclaceae bacterium]|nr:DUF2062 domain-containing protein [Rhodocyclaceae bacterium]MCP5255711.1 DUF2062 domain-containing protein [Zoogloeaceae bacterium]MCP5294886.1 DUF2062 domain-containing protein [Zoogloeaceae bacterium]MCW5615661.1 DUF2062 domain-containing protein [Rhodocyclaceae bacterium]